LLELAIVEEDIWIVEPTIKVTLDAFDGLDDAFQLFISGKHDECSIGPRFFCGDIGVLASGGKNTIVLFADFAGRLVSMDDG